MRWTFGVAAVVVLVFAASADGRSASALQLRAQFRQATMLDQGRRGPSIGDEQVASGALLDRSGRTVGSFGFTCTWVGLVRGNARESCSGWGTLAGGEVVVAGMSHSRDTKHVWAIVGGTGSYRAAHGQILIHDLNDTASDVTLHFA